MKKVKINPDDSFFTAMRGKIFTAIEIYREDVFTEKELRAIVVKEYNLFLDFQSVIDIKLIIFY